MSEQPEHPTEEPTSASEPEAPIAPPAPALATPMANVYMTLMHNMGLEDLQSFGDSTGEFSLSAAAATL